MKRGRWGGELRGRVCVHRETRERGRERYVNVLHVVFVACSVCALCQAPTTYTKTACPFRSEHRLVLQLVDATDATGIEDGGGGEGRLDDQGWRRDSLLCWVGAADSGLAGRCDRDLLTLVLEGLLVTFQTDTE